MELARNLKTNSPGGKFIWHSKVANLHTYSQMNFAHQLKCKDAYYRQNNKY